MTDQQDSSAQPKEPHSPRVLIVEDDPDQRELICETVRLHFARAEGASIVAVDSGAECLSQDLRDFDVVLLDHNLPDTSGVALLEKILAACDLPVIFVTGETVSTTAAEAIRCGAQDYVVKAGDYLFALPVVVEKNIRLHRIKQENARLQTQLTASLEEIRVKNLQLEESLRRLKTMAATDHLTGLANRRAFSQRLERCYGEAIRYEFDLACAMCDLDHYKALNDVLGHQAGDRVLVATAEVIRSNLRASDSAARYGGDEFVLLLPHTTLDMATSVGGRIRAQLSQTTRHYTKERTGVTLSIGIACLNSDRPVSADALVAMADRALYVAKDRGKDCIVTFAECGASPQPAPA